MNEYMKSKIYIILLFWILICLILFYSTILILHIRFVHLPHHSIQQYREGMKSNYIQIVTSRYNEDLKWLLEPPFNDYDVIVYNKGKNEDFVKSPKIIKIESIPNVGRESHSYLYHIIYQYDNLADITIFLPGTVDFKYKKEDSIKLIRDVEAKKTTCFLEKVSDLYEKFKNFQMEKYASRYQQNFKVNSENDLSPAPYRPFGKWFHSHWGNKKVTNMSFSGIFAVHKKDILQHPKSYYEDLIKELEVSSNPEVGHYFERAWGAVFSPP